MVKMVQEMGNKVPCASCVEVKISKYLPTNSRLIGNQLLTSLDCCCDRMMCKYFNLFTIHVLYNNNSRVIAEVQIDIF